MAPGLLHSLAHFACALRKTGQPVGQARVLTAIEGVAAAGFSSKHGFYRTLHTCFVNRPKERTVFDQMFRLF